MLIGITGKSGSGKSYISNMLSSMNDNIVILDIEKVGHSVIQIPEIKDKLIKAFNLDTNENGDINRKQLSGIVFTSKDKMKLLTNITWDPMREIIDDFISKNDNKTIILDWILLPNTHYFDMCALKILVDVPYEIRLERAMKRDGISKEKFDIREQASIEYQKEKFNYVIDNSNIEKTKGMVKQFYDESIISR